MNDSIRKENTICMAYCMNAIMSPTCMLRLRHLVRADPDDQQRQAVHDEHHHRHHDHHDAVDEQAGAGQVLVGLVEAVLLEVLHVEGADDHHARQVLARHQVEPVDQVLDDLELGQRQSRRPSTIRPISTTTATAMIHHMDESLADRADDAADADDRRVEDHAHHHDDHHLDLGDVVGGAGDQRGGGELVELGVGEALDLLEDILAQVARQPGSRAGREEADDDRAGDRTAATAAASAAPVRRM